MDYKDPKDFLEEVNLIWRNTYIYNRKGSSIYENAVELEKEFLSKVRAIEDEPPGKSEFKDSEDICGICGEGGELLICDGECLQAFHLRCLGLNSQPTTSLWYCSKCRRKAKNANTTPQGRSMRLSQAFNKSSRAVIDSSTVNIPLSILSANANQSPFVGTFRTQPPAAPMSKPALPATVARVQNQTPVRFTITKPSEPAVHLKRGAISMEEKVTRRKVNDSFNVSLSSN